MDIWKINRWTERVGVHVMDVWKINRLTEHVRVHVQPVHYYSEVPNRRWLRDHPELWARPIVPAGIEWDLDAQLRWLDRICAPHLAEVKPFSEYQWALGVVGPGYGPVEGQVLRCFVRATRPARIVEVGSGTSTAIAVQARDTNVSRTGEYTEITCIEPYPRPGLKDLDVLIVEELAQAVPLSMFTSLRPGDLLFIDSTHALHTGSELIRLYLEVLPVLPPGVVIHIHDIFLPYSFRPNVLIEDVFDWQETALLAALLVNNPRLKIRCCLSALCHGRPDDLRSVLPDLRPARFVNGLGTTNPGSHLPLSTWIETV